jgi:LPS O-antigen subunit length determinant protein (WzzB/FepE family)
MDNKEIISGFIRYDEISEEYHFEFENGEEYSSDTMMLFEEIDNLLLHKGKEITKTGDKITIIIERTGNS